MNLYYYDNSEGNSLYVKQHRLPIEISPRWVEYVERSKDGYFKYQKQCPEQLVMCEVDYHNSYLDSLFNFVLLISRRLYRYNEDDYCISDNLLLLTPDRQEQQQKQGRRNQKWQARRITV